MTVPTVNDYLVQARANRDHAEWLLAMRSADPTARQWAVTAMFYSALHGVTANLLSQGVGVRNHTERMRALMDPTSGVPRGVRSAYRALEVRSRGARYELRSFTAQEVRNLLDQELVAVAAFVGI
jgi:hypothetical protein